MISHKQILAPEQIAANLNYIKLLEINEKEEITPRVIEVAYRRLAKVAHPDKMPEKKSDDTFSLISEAHTKLLAAINFASPLEQGMGDLQQSKDKTLERLNTLEKVKQEEQQALQKALQSRAEIELKVNTCVLESKTAHSNLDHAVVVAKINAFKIKYTDLFKNKKLLSRISSEDFLKGKDALSAEEFVKVIEARIGKKPRGKVAVAWDVAKNTSQDAEAFSVLRIALRDWQAKLASERKRLDDLEADIVNLRQHVPVLEAGLNEARSKLSSIEEEMAQVSLICTSQKKLPSEDKASLGAMPNNDVDQEQKVIAFKKIYKALYAGQSGWMKSDFLPTWAKDDFLVGKENLTPQELQNQIKEQIELDPASREATAWNLAKEYFKNCAPSNVGLFSKVYNWSFDNSSYFKKSKVSGITFFSSTALQKQQTEFTLADIERRSQKPSTRTAKIYSALNG